MDTRSAVAGGNTTEIMAIMTRLLVDHLGVDEEDVTSAARLADDLRADSLDLIEITMAVEHEFGVEICDDDARACKTVRDIVALVLQSRARQESGDA